MSDYVFELNPDQYLYKANESKCYFVIHKCRLPGKNKDLFLIGDAFLRHFYSVYDFDKDQLSLGINVHSKGLVSMFKPGERPAEATKTEVSEDNVETKEKEVSSTELTSNAEDVHADSPDNKTSLGENKTALADN